MIGWTAAITAHGPFHFGILLAAVAPGAFFLGLAVFALIGTAITWHFHARPGAEVPS